MSSTDGLSPLGTLSKLPPELRFKVWHFLVPHLSSPDAGREETKQLKEQSKNSSRYTSPPKCLSILRTNPTLYEEVSSELYRRDLCFCINPAEARVFSVKCIPHALPEDFVDTPLDRFRKIAIEIQAPDRKDPGQLILGRDAVWQVISLIRRFFKKLQQKPIPPAGLSFLNRIEISFVNRASATWYNAGDWQRCIPNYGPEFDIDYFLCPFRFLRRIRFVEIRLPDQVENDKYISDFTREVVTSMQSPLPFGTRLYRTHSFEYQYDLDDSMILFDEETKFEILQRSCSDLVGKTAQLLKVSSAMKRSRCFDLETNYLVAPWNLLLPRYFNR